MSREFRLVRVGKCPTSSIGVVLLLYSQVLKVGEELTSFQAVDCSLELSLLREGLPLLYFKVDPPIYIFLS